MEKIFNSDYLKHLCQKYGLQPSKKYGQNFLINPEVLEEILSAAELKANETVVEVGPGFGVLTLPLAERVKKVVAFEIERKLAPYWANIPNCHSDDEGGISGRISPIKPEISRRARNDKRGEIQIVWGNILKIFNDQFQISNYKVVANLPYQITSAVVRLFLESENSPKLMVLMVQKEVAERICAKPGEMSLLSVATQYYADPQMVAVVPRTNFWPEPKVDSAVIKLTIKKHTVSDVIPAQAGIQTPGSPIKSGMTSEFFFKTVKAGFSSKRKMLIKNLTPLCGKNKAKLREIFSKIGLNEKVRAQELSVEQWKKLAGLICHCYSCHSERNEP